MARPRTFDRQEVLDRAMQLFCERGFESTSIQDLVDCMGIGRASLYDTFGSKEALMFEAMDCYVARMKQHLLDALHADAPAPQVVRNLLQSVVERSLTGEAKSCLVAKSAMLTGGQHAQIMDRVITFVNTIEEELFLVLSRGIAAGEIPAAKNPRDLARFFTFSIQGINMTAHTQGDRHALQSVVEVTLSVLR